MKTKRTKSLPYAGYDERRSAVNGRTRDLSSLPDGPYPMQFEPYDNPPALESCIVPLLIELRRTAVVGIWYIGPKEMSDAITIQLGSMTRFVVLQASFWGWDSSVGSQEQFRVIVNRYGVTREFLDSGTLGKVRPKIGIYFPPSFRRIFGLTSDPTQQFISCFGVESVQIYVQVWKENFTVPSIHVQDEMTKAILDEDKESRIRSVDNRDKANTRKRANRFNLCSMNPDGTITCVDEVDEDESIFREMMASKSK